MLIYDDIYSWSGWGGKLKLGSGKCRLRIYDLKKGNNRDLMHLRPIIVVVSDVKDSKISIRSCSSHIATLVTKAFNIDPLRMLWVEYYPEHKYGAGDTHSIPEKLDAVEFSWHGDKAI
ncbi:MAG: hypothetical protein P8012_04300, partial [Desulfobacterales bacterium]